MERFSEVRHHMKKILLVLTMTACLLGLTACGGKKSDSDFDVDSCKKNAEAVLTQIVPQLDDATIEQFLDMSTEDLDSTMKSNSMPMSGEAFRGILETWQSAGKEGGEFKSLGKWKSKVNGKELTLTTTAKYEKRDADLTVIFNKNSKISSIGIDMQYSTGEILKKAALNTVLGMGTVFVILILISIIISGFGLISKTQKEPAKDVPKVEVSEARPAAEPADVTDDLEIAAVITAAIAASTGESCDSFVVRSIKRRSTNKWNKA